MKKIITLIAAIGFAFSGMAQDGANDKNFRFGLHVDPSFNWLTPDDTKKFSNGGMKFGTAVGAVMDFKLGENIWFSTGLNLDFTGAKVNYLKDTIGYYFKDDAIIDYDSKKNTWENDTAGADFVWISSRDYSANYLNIPLTLKMKTKEIGYLTYYGQFGMLASFKTKARTTDVGESLNGSNSLDLTELNIDNELGLFKGAAVIGFGAEYNVSGSTSLFGSVTYNYGFTNYADKTSEHLINYESNATQATAYADQKFIPHAVRVSIGILF